MLEKRFSFVVILLSVGVALGIAVIALSGGLFVGYQMGKTAGRAEARAEFPAGAAEALGPLFQGLGPRGDLEDLFPGGELPGDRLPRFQGDNRPFLGITFQVITEELAEQEGLAVESGALILEVVHGSPADHAGLHDGDIIHAVDGAEVGQQHPLPELINSYRPGDVVELTVIHQGDRMTIEVELGARPRGGSFEGDFLGEMMPFLGQPQPFLQEMFPEPGGFQFRYECGPDGCEFFEGDS